MANFLTGPSWFAAQGRPPAPAPVAPVAAPVVPPPPPAVTRTPTGHIPTMDERTGQEPPPPAAPPPAAPAPAPAAPPAAAPQSGGYQPYSDAALQAILHKYDPSDARQAVAEIDRTFGPGVVTLMDHPLRHDKFVTPTGTYDTVIGAGGPNPQWGWMREGAGTATGPTAGGPAGTASTLGGLSGVGVSPHGWTFANWAISQGMPPEGRYFADRVLADRGAVGPLLGDPMAGKPITDDPSYQFRLNEGMKALERSAAARGTLLTGGAAKAMQRYAQDVASTEYANSYGRRADEQANDYGRLAGVANFTSGEQQNQYTRMLGAANFMANQQTNQFGRYYDTANLGLNATTNAQNTAAGYAANQANAQLGLGNTQAGAATANGIINANQYTQLGGLVGQGINSYYNRDNRARNQGGIWERPPTPGVYPGSNIPVGTGLP